ncbi:ArnT family glycosyltransferase [Spirosoma pollinicola]|uniref:Glycosyl transferase n=1 Tax=Spirosoma pollinicola TaxID=2057025 RepID=A0A2K8Z3K9_9BACT|nr:glycosyltransferase family 39 protein [Spirosoma pollinicola]AUD04455.1 glycosyl transferase [Spirosoma pollinicola]
MDFPTTIERPSVRHKTTQWPLIISVGLVVVLVSHLGFMPLDTGDEARRALVSLEMMLSGDYITPTLHGERYFNKPPLYNWLIIGSYRLFGDYSSFALRFPMLVSLLLLGLTMFVVVRKYTNSTVAWVAALMTLTNGRVLLYDSMLGLIEITFSLAIYAAMMLVYYYDRKRNYWLLYLTTYTLTALAFLLKGLPPVAFQALTLLGWFVYTRRVRLLFHPAHVVGIGVFLLITGSYYAAYFSQNAIPYQDVASVLLSESTKRTGLYFGWGPTLLHLITFPFEFIYHFAPFTLLVVLLMRRDLLPTIKKSPFVVFNALTFILTVLIYWSSPQAYGRYLIGLIPMFFTVLAYLYCEHSSPADRGRWWVERIWLVTTLVVAVGVWTAVFYPTTRVLPGVFWKTAVISILLSGLAWQMTLNVPNRLVLMIAVFIVIRMGFNWLVLPGRATKRQFYQESATQAANQTRGHRLYGYKTTVGDGPATDVSSFHITAARGEILRLTDKKIADAYYIGDSVTLANEHCTTIGRMVLFDRHPASIVQFK